jgi:hypothetical protein
VRRRQRGLIGAGLAMAVLLVGTGSLLTVNAMARRTVQERHVYAFRGTDLSVELAIGEVQIVPSARDDQVTVRRRLTYGLQRPGTEARIDGEIFRVRDAPCAAPVASSCHVRWLLEVPRFLTVNVRTASGAINVSGISGRLHLLSDDGDIKAVSASGPKVTLLSTTGTVTAQNLSSQQVVGTSTDGDVSLTFRTPPSLAYGKSELGSVEVVLPPGPETYRINANNSPEGLRTVLVQDDIGSRRRVDVSSVKGDVRVLTGSIPGD